MKLKQIFWKIIDEIKQTITYMALFSSIWILVLYLLLPIVSYYFQSMKIKQLAQDNQSLSKIIKGNDFKKINFNKNISSEQNDNLNNIKISYLWKEIYNKLDSTNKLERIKKLIRQSKNADKQQNNNDDNNNKNLNKKMEKNVNNKQKNQNILNLYPLKDFILHSNKIYINGESSNIIYKDIESDIQKDLWANSVISLFYWTPIIFTHSSGWKYNFGIYYLYLKKWDSLFLRWKYLWLDYFIELKVVDIFKNILWTQLYNWLAKIFYKYNFDKDKVIYLDTCEINWSRRRIVVAKISNIYIK